MGVDCLSQCNVWVYFSLAVPAKFNVKLTCKLADTADTNSTLILRTSIYSLWYNAYIYTNYLRSPFSFLVSVYARGMGEHSCRFLPPVELPKLWRSNFDGKHITIVCPQNSGSYFYNYKGFHSIVLLAVVDAKYNFIMVDVGCNGRISDGGVIEGTEFYNLLKNHKLNLPGIDETLEGLGFVFLGDSAFSIRPDLLKPFPNKNMSHNELIYRV